MAILLIVLVVCGLLFLAARAWRGYEVEYRKAPGTVGVHLRDVSPEVPLAGSDSSSHQSHSVPHNSGDVGCPDSHHAGCDFGDHSGFDSGGHH